MNSEGTASRRSRESGGMKAAQQRQQQPQALVHLSGRKKVQILAVAVSGERIDDPRQPLPVQFGKMVMPSQRHPQHEPGMPTAGFVLITGHRQQARTIRVADPLPTLVGLRSVFVTKPGTEDLAVLFLPVEGDIEEALAQVEDALHAKAELADRTVVGSLAVQPE